ncbi:hypothetical protein C2U72_27795 [Prosthecomicrobium hirschii]|uniref:hypothetical protein n=1 Tax=Prosthecodimorpha hirschii TaxID=665126 RepID=UPI0011290A1E|nr:hypothetical protein [Prosthecomicrobium hirschii]TPQ44423.1 hypothetical protein C2U72_27795 [Prosthecomicrobium hirschii]
MERLVLTLDFNRIGNGAYETTCSDLDGFRFVDADLGYSYQLGAPRIIRWFHERTFGISVEPGVFKYPDPPRPDVMLCAEFTLSRAERSGGDRTPRCFPKPQSELVEAFLLYWSADEIAERAIRPRD